jgi:hypothetical protein
MRRVFHRVRTASPSSLPDEGYLLILLIEQVEIVLFHLLPGQEFRLGQAEEGWA